LTITSAQEELDRVLHSRVFANSPRLARLLRYIVEKSVAGDRESLKEYSIGLDVFDRETAFDPKADSIVRSSARHLRVKLEEYYRAECAGTTVRIVLPKGSYVAQFEECAAAPAAPAVAPEVRPPLPSELRRKASKRRYIAAALVPIAALAVLAAVLARNHHQAMAAPRTVAVLPFRDLSPNRDLGYLGEELRDGLTSALVRTNGLEVVARASSSQMPAEMDPAEAAKMARAGTVLAGSVARAGDKLQVVVSLVDGATGKYLWSQDYSGTAADVGAVEHSAAAGVAAALGVSHDVAAPELPRNPEALELFIRASALARSRQPDRMREAARLFERVMSLEPEFAPGYAAAASTYLVAVSNGGMSWAEGGPRGVELARKAAGLDASLVEAHAALGLALEAEWNWEEAYREFSRAIELDPRSPLAHFRMAVDLICRGRFSEGGREIETARMLDPSWDAPDRLLAELYYYWRRWDDALGLAKRIRATRPDGAGTADNIGWRVYIAQRKFDLARPFLAAAPDPYTRAWLRAIDGDAAGAWRDLLVQRRSSGASAFRLAAFAAWQLQDRAAALDWLEQSLRDHEPDLVSLAIDPVFDPVRGDPRAQTILRRINLAR